MSREEREQGKGKVEWLLKDMCVDRAIILGPRKWTNDFDHSRWWLETDMDGQIVRWPFPYEQLEDCVNDRNVNRQLEAQLRQYVVRGGASADPPQPATPESSEQHRQKSSEQCDVFVSHASEDKPYVEPLVREFQKAGISVWYDRDSMEWGDSLRQGIDKGQATCRFGIVVLSKVFLRRKKWTERELDGLFAREELGQKIILPIWHGIDRADLLEYSPAFADRIAKLSHLDDYANIVGTLLKMLGRTTEQPTKPQKMTTVHVHESAAGDDLAARTRMDADRGWVLASVAGQPMEPLTKHLLESGIHPGIVWKLEIFGNTPIKILHTDFRCRIVDTDPNVASQPWLEPHPVYFPKNEPEGRIMYPPGKTFHYSIPLEHLVNPQPNVTLLDRLTQIPIGAGYIVSYGRVVYEDAFKRKGVTQFCAIYRPHRGGVIQSPDGTVLNPVGFYIAGPPEYNYNT